MADAGTRVAGALSQVDKIGFPEFTGKLIMDVVDAIVAATLKQIKSFEELVKELDAGVEAFKAKAVTAEAVDKFLVDAWPGSTTDTSAVVAGGTYDHAMFQEITGRLGNIDGMSDPGQGTATFTESQVTQIKARVKDALDEAADRSFQHLKSMVELGYARVIFTDGRILTKLTFSVDASDSSARQTSDYASSSFSASASAHGSFLGRLIGLSGRTAYSRVHVATVNTQAVSTDKAMGQIIGEVEVKFTTQTFPKVETLKTAAVAQPPQ